MSTRIEYLDITKHRVMVLSILPTKHIGRH